MSLSNKPGPGEEASVALPNLHVNSKFALVGGPPVHFICCSSFQEYNLYYNYA